MKVKLSRHAARRAKLYNISESALEKILMALDLDDGEHSLVEDMAGFKYPIKITIKVENKIITVITNYPLKKGRKQ
jgi:hypothetical protein